LAQAQASCILHDQRFSSTDEVRLQTMLTAGAPTNGNDLRNILIMTNGSRGDVQPYIALAMGLKKAGYNVAIMSNQDHKNFVEELGVASRTVLS